VIWGAWHGLFLVLERTPFGRLIKIAPGFVKHVYVLLVVMVGWVFFRAETLPQAFAMLSAMFSVSGWLDPLASLRRVADNYELFLIVVGALLTWPLRRHVEARLFLARRRFFPSQTGFAEPAKLALAVARAVVYCAVLVLSLSAMAANTHQAFIYFRF
jgi:alginate O-acetyltransferase complex protein AlgI